MNGKEFTCPFCGRTATVEQFFIDGNDWFQTVCLSCGESSFFFDTPEEAIRAWQEEAASRK